MRRHGLARDECVSCIAPAPRTQARIARPVDCVMTTDQTDFMGLYRELGVAPDCSVDEFRLAYRRRVSGLHPDRAGASGEDDLKTLNLHYAAALDFHRHYGRLPGAAPAAASPRRRSRAAPAHQEDAAQDPDPPARGPSKFVVYGMLVLAALLAWWWSRTDAEPFAIDSVGIVGNERQTATAAATRLLLPGMTPDEVLALHGEPVGWDGEAQWLYGPSWIRFRCARVVDWYSSPLKPLKAAASKPSSAELSRLQPEGPLCPPMPPPRTRPWPTSP